MNHECCFRFILMRLNTIRGASEPQSSSCDIQLEAGDGSLVRAHSVILSAWSESLHLQLQCINALKAIEYNKSIHTLKVPDLNGDGLNMVVNFMYGHLPCSLSESTELLKGLKVLGVHTGNLTIDRMLGCEPHNEGQEDNVYSNLVGDNLEATIKNEPVDDNGPVFPLPEVVQDPDFQSGTKDRSVSRKRKFYRGQTEEEYLASDNDEVPENVSVEEGSDWEVQSDVSDYKPRAKPKKAQGRRKFKLTCKVCKMQFKQKSRYDEHIKLHSDGRVMNCKKCGRPYKFTKSLLKHEEKCVKVSEVITDQSDTNVEDGDPEPAAKVPKVEAKEGAEEGDEEGSEKGEEEGSDEGDEKSPDLNNEIMSSVKGAYSCKKCFKVFKFTKALRRHSSKCTGKGWNRRRYRRGIDHKCTECGHVAKTMKALADHHNQEHRDPLPCPECTHISYNMWAHKRHIRKNHKKGNGIFRCEPCDKVFPSETRLDAHNNQSHGPGHICTICGKHIITRSGYDKHIRVQHANECRYNCDKCKARFLTIEPLQKHMRLHHSDRTTYMCMKCGKGFAQESTLKYHEAKCQLRENENIVKTNQCDICGLVCKNPASLAIHKKGKHGNKKYQCELCKKEFIWRQGYNRHKQRCKGPEGGKILDPIEEAKKILACPQCPMRYSRMESLKEHISAKHTPAHHTCPICKISFTWKSNLYKHRKKCAPNVVMPRTIGYRRDEDLCTPMAERQLVTKTRVYNSAIFKPPKDKEERTPPRSPSPEINRPWQQQDFHQAKPGPPGPLAPPLAGNTHHVAHGNAQHMQHVNAQQPMPHSNNQHRMPHGNTQHPMPPSNIQHMPHGNIHAVPHMLLETVPYLFD